MIINGLPGQSDTTSLFYFILFSLFTHFAPLLLVLMFIVSIFCIILLSLYPFFNVLLTERVEEK
jgi:hypothetical protein